MSIALSLLLSLSTLPPTTWDTAGEATFAKAPRVVTEVVPGFLWVDAEDFADYGGWKLDTQYVHLLGSAYLIAPGIGTPVDDATTTIHAAQAGTYRLWVRARDWLPEYHPGRFQVQLNGATLEKVLGEEDHTAWRWIDLGRVPLQKGENSLALHDISGYFARCDALLFSRDPEYTPPESIKGIEVERARMTGLDLSAQHLGDFDVIVVGGGPTGCPAAIAAARMGAKTALIQDRPVLGGNASLELGVSMQGASIAGHNVRETGIVEEASRLRIHNGWRRISLPYHQLTDAEENLTVFLNTRVVDAEKEDASTIATVKGMNTLTGEYTTYGAKLFIDCTGDGWVGYYAGAKWMLGREARAEYNEPDAPEKRDNITMSGCIMGQHGCGFTAEYTDNPVAYTAPPWAAQVPDLDKVRRNPRNLTSGEWWMEHDGKNWYDLYDSERARDELIRISFGVWDYYKNRWSDRAKMETAKLRFVPWMVAKRETRRLVGDHVLTANEILDGTTFPDTISYGGWPLDIHNPDGIYKGDSPYDTNHHLKQLCNIPYRTLFSINIDNLFMAGRCASFTHYGLGTVRVERTLATLGQAAGTAAALCVQKDLSPRELGLKHIETLQQTLLKQDQYIPGFVNEDPNDLARSATVTASSTAAGLQFDKDRLRLSDVYHGATHKRALMLPVAQGYIGTARIYLRSELQEDITLRMGLRKANGSKDFSSTADIGYAEAVLSAGASGWVTFRLDQEINSSHAWLWLPPMKGVYWRLMSKGFPGMQRAFASMEDGKEVWFTPGGYYACIIDPPAMLHADCAPENVINGHARIIDGVPNMWLSDPTEGLPQWLELTFPKPIEINTVQLTFYTDLNTQHFGRTNTLSGTRAYDIMIPDGAGWKTLVREKDNCQRWRRHSFDTVTTQKLRISIEALAEMPYAGIYEVRAYNE